MSRFSLAIRKSFPPTEKVRFQVSLPVIAGKGPISKTASDEFMKRYDIVHANILTISDGLLTLCFLTLTANKLLVGNLIE